MITYKEYEQKIYNWLSTKNSEDPNFTFSVRKKRAKGAEANHFIGTEKSAYFSTTFWYLPVGFPGSSGDCIALLFRHSEKGLNYTFEFTQTMSPHDAQNSSALNLCKSLQDPLRLRPGLQRESAVDNKMFTIHTQSKQRNYQLVEDMIRDIELDLNHIIELVNQKITEEKLRNPEFSAHRITPDEFAIMNKKLHERIAKYEGDGNVDTESTGVKYWLFAPGENASKWEEFYAAGIMGLGWNKLGDLNNYTTREEIATKLRELENADGSKNNDAMANYDFKDTIAVGDVIIAKRGRREYVGYGIVTSDYYYDESRTDYQKCRKVDWKNKGVWQEDGNDIVLKTLTDITKYPQYVDKLIKLIGIGTSEESTKHEIGYRAPINQILYGPPGTGKTYNTVLEAAKIVTGISNLNYGEALKIFNENLGAQGQIEFVTFHQNFSYEDFIQGLRPDIDNKQLSFERKDGIFKRIADRAYLNLVASEKKHSQKLPFATVFQQFAVSNIEEGKEIEVKMIKTSYFITDISEKTIYFRKTSGGTAHTLSIQSLERMYLSESIGDIQGLASYYEPLLNILLKHGKSTTVQEVQRKNYVIIIDEINRANISRVFGELITLIEEDKRSHGAIPMRVTLPSGDTFIVPSNLYIIGTMNTADKSIALLDIALRRRFNFVPKFPDSELEGVYNGSFLNLLNKGICEKKGRDFQIGHAYFMENEDLNFVMNNKVIPLLLEYFMNDEKTVQELVSINGCKVDSTVWPMKFSKN